MSVAYAYINHGRVVADCPHPECPNAEILHSHPDGEDCISCPMVPPKMRPQLHRKDEHFLCSYCRQIATVEWPDNLDELWEVLARRPVPTNRNWFPTGHDLARRAGAEAGQTVQDLEEENREHGVTA